MAFVIAISLAMLGMLRSMAELASVQVGLKTEIEGRQRSDEIALDCIYIATRTLVVIGSISELESKALPIMDGFCTIVELMETPIYDTDNAHVLGTRATFAVLTDLKQSIPDPVVLSSRFYSKINAEIKVIDGKVNLIKI